VLVHTFKLLRIHASPRHWVVGRSSEQIQPTIGLIVKIENIIPDFSSGSTHWPILPLNPDGEVNIHDYTKSIWLQ
jgi:hypothetical protein